MEEGLIAGFTLSFLAIGAGVVIGVISTIFYAALWYLRK